MSVPHGGSGAQQPPPRTRRFADARIALVLFACAAVTGMTYVSNWGGTAYFYQRLFGPAVMFACGRGYVNPDLTQAPELAGFLHVEDEFNAGRAPDVDAFSPDALPQNLDTVPLNAIQRRQRYLIGAVALVWAWLGVSWPALAPLYGLLYAASVTAAYGLFRLGMRRVFAVVC
ncbi:MAG: hypothetical protein GWP08_19205, partial [Nitrospiraceae bacterium]|nr:hypothetical protein [Nitrospiraceae bacterium]